MNIFEACKILGVKTGTSMDEVKKAWKRLSLEFHPDRNPSPTAEQDIKRVNEAYQYLEKHGTIVDIPKPHATGRPADPFSNFNLHTFDFWYNSLNTQCNINMVVDVPFEDFVLGGSVDISWERKIYVNNVKTTIKENSKITFPPNSQNPIIIRGKGNGSEIYSFKDYVGHVLVSIQAKPDPDMKLDNGDVISNIELTFLEALKGTKKQVRTVKGEKTLTFQPKTRNKDIVRVSGFGSPPNGAHIFIVDVKYPDNVSKIIELLEKEQVIEIT